MERRIQTVQPQKVSRLYSIDIECPFVHADSLRFYGHRGWDWLTNLSIDMTAYNIQKIQDQQKRHGRLNVTLGHPLNEDTGRPCYINNLVGLYVRRVVVD